MVIRTLIPTPKAKQLHASGLTDPEIALELGFTAESVSKWRRRNHLKSNGIMGRKPKHIKVTVLPRGVNNVKENA